MTLIQAIKAAAGRATIVSNVGKRYTAAELAPIRCGDYNVSFRKGTMVESEWKRRLGRIKMNRGVREMKVCKHPITLTHQRKGYCYCAICGQVIQ